MKPTRIAIVSVALASVLAVIACGSSDPGAATLPVDAGDPLAAGNSCSGEDNAACDTYGFSVQPFAAFCEGGKFHPYVCSGPNGCIGGSGSSVLCDMSGANAGDPCPHAFRDTGACKAGVTDGGVLLVCTDGGVYTAQTCAASCSVSNGKVTCQ